MGSYAQLAASAKKLLQKKGQTVTLRSFTTGTYDTETGTATISSADTLRSGVDLDYGSGQTTVRGSLIQANDRRLLLDATGVVNLQDHLIVKGVEYSIVSIGEINPAGTSVLFDLHLRKG